MIKITKELIKKYPRILDVKYPELYIAYKESRNPDVVDGVEE